MTFRVQFEHHDALLRCALDEFCDRGYDAASINQILTKSAMSKGQLYHHFSGKEGLYLALVEWMIDQKIAWLAAHPATFDEDFFELLGAHMRASVTFAATHPDIDRMSTALLAERGRPIFDAVTERFAFDPDSMFAMLIASSYDKGQFRRDLSLDFVQRTILHLVNHAPQLLDVAEPSETSARVDELMRFLCGGLAAAR